MNKCLDRQMDDMDAIDGWIDRWMNNLHHLHHHHLLLESWEAGDGRDCRCSDAPTELLFLLIDVAVLLLPVEATSSIGRLEDEGGIDSSSMMMAMKIDGDGNDDGNDDRWWWWWWWWQWWYMVMVIMMMMMMMMMHYYHDSHTTSIHMDG